MTELMRLGTAALYELAWRARGAGGAADNGTVDVVLPDPEVACTTSDGQRHMLCDLELPAHGTAAAMRLSTSLHAFCCEAAAANGHWDAVGRHARMGLACQRSVERGRPARHVQTPWQQLWFVHASLLARTMGGGAAGVVVGTFVDPQATLLRQARAQRATTHSLRRRCSRWQRGWRFTAPLRVAALRRERHLDRGLLDCYLPRWPALEA